MAVSESGDSEPEAAKWNSAVMNFYYVHLCFSYCQCLLWKKVYLKCYCTILTYHLPHRQGECIISVHVQCSKWFSFPSKNKLLIYIGKKKKSTMFIKNIFICVLSLVCAQYFSDFKTSVRMQPLLKIGFFSWQSKLRQRWVINFAPRERRNTFSTERSRCAGKGKPVPLFPSLSPKLHNWWNYCALVGSVWQIENKNKKPP